MKRILLLSCLGLGLVFASCSSEKCRECTYTVAGVSQTVPKVCSKETKDLDTYENSAKASATAVGATATCKEVDK